MSDARKGMHVVVGQEEALLKRSRPARRRATVMLVVFVLAAAGITARLAWLQLYRGEAYDRLAYIGQNRQQQIRPTRGSIFDRNGKGLAISAEVATVSVNPALLLAEVEKRPQVIPQIADNLSSILGIARDSVYADLTSSESFVYIARKIDKEKGEAARQYLQSIKVGSVYVDKDAKRFYPKGSLASHVIGYTGTDDQGLLGMELKLDGTLKGESGRILSEVDARGNPVSYDESMRLDVRDGYNVTLTIDETIQDMTEEALAGIITQWNVRNGASAIAMDPDSGEVLAMASLPDFDPNRPDAQPAAWLPAEGEAEWKGFADKANTDWLWQHVFRNKAVMDTYEPGSTFKSITAAAALEYGIVTENTPVVDEQLVLADWPINCWKAGGHGAESFREAVYNSCNPVFAKVSLQLGLERFYNMVRLFGFQERTGIEIAGEPSNTDYRGLWHAVPTELDMAVASFGQRFQVSPIQMITAYTAIANGGRLMKPTIIKEITDAEGRLVSRNEPQVVRQVLSESTSRTLRDILEGVVSEGTGKNAYISGYRMAGKTGTSETRETEEGHYIVSFMCFAPADDPEVCLLIEVDWPQAEVKSDVAGGKIVAPVAGKLMEGILSYLKVEREYSVKDQEAMTKEVYLPDVMDETVAAATERLAAYGFAVEAGTEGQKPEDIVTRVYPAVGGSVPQGSTVTLYVGQHPAPVMVVVTQVSGRTVEEARAALRKAGLNLRISGSGIATAQEPAAGVQVERGEVVGVQFEHAIAD